MCEEIKEGEKRGETGTHSTDKSLRTGHMRRRDMVRSQPLVALLIARRAEQGLRMSDLAAKIGITQPYLSQLLSGQRAFSTASVECLRAISIFLNIPPIRVFLLAGLVTQSDLGVSFEEARERHEQTMLQISTSSYAQDAAVSLADINQLPESMQFLLMLLYHSATRAEFQHRWARYAGDFKFVLHTHRSE